MHYRKWLLTTGIEDQFSGRIFEYIWHYIFTGHEVYCPSMSNCYCDGYGLCFGGLAKFNAFIELQDKRNAENEKLSNYNKKEDQAKKDGIPVNLSEDEIKEKAKLKEDIGVYDAQMNKLREDAWKRGEDMKMRKEEMENYDSSRIWDYAPKNN